MLRQCTHYISIIRITIILLIISILSNKNNCFVFSLSIVYLPIPLYIAYSKIAILINSRSGFTASTMMNPQYIQPGQNNNSPNNPIDFPPSGQDFNGHQNANIYPPMPTNGPPSSMMPQKPGPDVTQKLQNMNLNGPQGYSAIPPGQLPPGVAPPTSMMGQPPNQRVPQAFPPNGSNRPQQFPQQPMSTPGHTPVSHPQFQVPPQSQKSEAPHSKPFLPPSQVPPSMASPLNQPSQLLHQGMPQNIPQNQPGFPSQPNQGVPPGFAAHPGMPGGTQTSQAGPTMSGLPHMPPPLNQGRQQFQPAAASQPGTVKPPGPATSFAGTFVISNMLPTFSIRLNLTCMHIKS